MKIECPSCKQQYKIEDSEEGKLFECPVCKKQFRAETVKAPDLIDEERMARLMKCPDCGKMISYRARQCPNCGYYDDINEVKNQPAKTAQSTKVEVISINPSTWEMLKLTFRFWIFTSLISIIAYVIVLIFLFFFGNIIR